MKKYESYKPLSELWLSSIPTHWKSRKIKYLFSERSEKGYPDEPLLVASQNMGVVPKHIYGNRTVEAMKDLHLLKLVRVGDFVISLRSFQGGIEYAYYQGIISPAYTIMIPKDMIVPYYFKYLAKSRLFIELLQLCVTGIREGQNIDYNKLKNHQIPVPPRSEQDQIVRYLDWQVSKINRLILAIKKEIEHLQELKAFYINKAVVNGVDNFGQVMNSSEYKWQQVKIGYKAWIRARLGWRGLKATEYVDDGYPFLSAFNIVNDKLVWDNINFINQFRYDESPEIKLSVGDILLVKDGAGIGKCARIDNLPLGASAPNGSLAVITPNEEFYYKYLYYYLISNDFKNATNKIITGMGVPHLTQHFLKNVEVPCPPLDIQHNVVEYLDEKCKILDLMIEHKQATIETLHELLIRLISDVVTGQIDVRGIEIPEYEYVEEESDEETDEMEGADEEAEEQEE